MNRTPPAGQFGETTGVVSDALCVVYDTTSGAILHRHRVVTFEGGSEPSRQQIAEDALSYAKDHISADLAVDVLHLDPGSIEIGQKYRVDPDKRMLLSEA